LQDALLEGQGKGELPKVPIFEESLTKIWHNTNPHCVYLMALEQIGHYLVLETKWGVARLWQSYIKDAQEIETSGIVALHTGFSAREWALPMPHPRFSTAMVACHQRWGGSIEISFQELRQLLDIVAGLKSLAGEMAAALAVQLPQALQQVGRQCGYSLDRLIGTCHALTA
jgi:hypothetical protein